MTNAELQEFSRLRTSSELRHDALYGDDEDELDMPHLAELDEMDEETIRCGSPLSPKDKSPQGRAASDAALAAMGVVRTSPGSSPQDGAAEVEMSSLLREGESGGSGVDGIEGVGLADRDPGNITW